MSSKSLSAPGLRPKPTRPEQIRGLLEVAERVDNNELELYKKFLTSVEKAQRDMFSIQSTCTVTMFHKLESYSVAGSKTEGGNSSLRAIFYFYAKLQMTGNFTFEDVDVSNITISFYELISVMRDFHLIPTLLSREEVQFAWKVMSLQSVKEGYQVVTELDFNQFREFLARCSIIAYNRPGMRRLILNSNGQMPSHERLVEMVARTMKLYDYSYVKDRIRTLGKDRVINQNRGVDGSNEELKRELREDLEAKRLARLMASSNLQGTKTSNKTNDDEAAKKIASAMHTKITGLNEDDEESANSKGGNPKNPVASGGLISEIQERELRNFDPITTRIFDKYSVNPVNQAASGSNDGFRLTDGAFLDLGELLPGRRCVLNIIVRNNCNHDVQLDVTARGFPSKDLHVVTLPNSFAPGMTRNVTVTFTVHQEVFDVLGFVDVVIVPVRKLPAISLSCPVYYRVIESIAVRRFTPFPICSSRNIPELLRKYCGRDITPKVTFEKTRQWYSGAGLQHGPSFVQERIEAEPTMRGEKLERSSVISEGSSVVTVPGCHRGLRTYSPRRLLTTKASGEMEFSDPDMI